MTTERRGPRREAREISARLHVQDGQYSIFDADPEAGFVLPDPGGGSGLVCVSPGLAIVIAGTQFGSVALTVRSAAADPGVDPGSWDEVVEVSLVSGPGAQELGITSGGQGPRKLATLTPAGEGSYPLLLG